MQFVKFRNINFGINMKRRYLTEPYEREGYDCAANYYVWKSKTNALHQRFIEITRNCEQSPELDYITAKWYTYLDCCLLYLKPSGHWDIDFERHTKRKLWNKFHYRKHQLNQRRGFDYRKDSSPIILTTHPIGKFYGLIRSLIHYWEATYFLYDPPELPTPTEEN